MWEWIPSLNSILNPLTTKIYNFEELREDKSKFSPV
jgi:hypothetical protein